MCESNIQIKMAFYQLLWGKKQKQKDDWTQASPTFAIRIISHKHRGFHWLFVTFRL